MVRSIRIVGKLISLGLISGVLALPLAAEEVTVTVPPDDAPAQATAPAAAPEAASPSAPLPSFSGGDNLQKPVADGNDPTAHPTDAAEAPPPPAAPVKHKTKKKAAAAAPAAVPADGAAGAAPTEAAAKPAAKPKTAKASPCLNLDENACGGNSACIWVAAGTNDAGKATKARCRSLAILKKEAAKKAKAEKTATPEVLPWAKGASGTTTSSTTPATSTKTAAAEPSKPKKTKTASAKKVSKPKAVAAPAAAPPPAPAETDTVPGGDPQSSSGAD